MLICKSNKIITTIQLLIFAAAFIISLSGCATPYTPVDTTNINDLKNLTQQQMRANKPTVSKIRLEALKDTALTIGSQGGLAWRANQLNIMFNQNAAELDQTFNFNGLLLDKNVIPPVLEYSQQSLNLAAPDVIRLSDSTYKIIKQAHFVTTAPTWREYLLMPYKKPGLPDSTLLPKSKRERKIWEKYIEIGWQNGIKQANTIYSNNLAELQRDFNGMILYKKLLAQNIVSKPFVAEANIGTTSNLDRSEIHVNDRILRITAIPKLNPNSKKWRPVLVTKDES